MKIRPGFLEGVVVAIILSIVATAVYAMFHPFMAAGFLLRWLLSGVSLGYVLYLLWRSQERIGRVTVLVVWFLANAGIWVFYPPVLLFVMLQLVLIWLIRSLYFYSGVLPALMDLGLVAVAAMLAIVGGLYTSSLFVGLWCFFLCQALFVFIPTRLQGKPPAKLAEDRFECAHRAATAALRKLSSI